MHSKASNPLTFQYAGVPDEAAGHSAPKLSGEEEDTAENDALPGSTL